MKIDDRWKWLARDEVGTLYAYDERPIKGKFGWYTDGLTFKPVKGLDDKYPFIKWGDEEPFHIQEAKQCLMEFNRINTKDNINKPLHYHSNGIDVIGFAEAQFSKEEQKGFHRINAIKYITRYDRKNGVEDLQKAKFYIDKLIEMEESE